MIRKKQNARALVRCTESSVSVENGEGEQQAIENCIVIMVGVPTKQKIPLRNQELIQKCRGWSALHPCFGDG
eukprot:scaffold935_cov196-Alexandrium_tamarense.AAC.19